MCRWLAFITSARENAILVADLILRVENGLVHQSYDATYTPGFTRQNNAILNADGFGIGWYHDVSDEPALFKSSKPLWCDNNAKEIASSTKSTCIFGHVRAAAIGGVVSEQNCHPFKFGSLMMQHNGHIEGFSVIKRGIIERLDDRVFEHIHGTTDTEYFFALFLTNLGDFSKTAYHGHELSQALTKSIRDIVDLQTIAGVNEGFTTLNIAVTDGSTLIVSRFCDKSPTIPPPSLYYTIVDGMEFAQSIEERHHQGQQIGPGDGRRQSSRSLVTSSQETMHLSKRAASEEDINFSIGINHGTALIVSSEPLLANADTWVPIKENSVIAFCATEQCISGKKIEFGNI